MIQYKDATFLYGVTRPQRVEITAKKIRTSIFCIVNVMCNGDLGTPQTARSSRMSISFALYKVLHLKG